MPNRAIARSLCLALVVLGCGPSGPLPVGDPPDPLPVGERAGPVRAGEYVLESQDASGDEISLRLRLYLPEGAGPGRAFFIDDALADEGGPLVREAGTFDADGHATLSCVYGCTATLDAETACVTVTTTGTVFYDPHGGDVAPRLAATDHVCPVAGDPAWRGVRLVPPTDPGASAPLSALAVRAWVPLDESTLSSLRLSRDGADVPVHYEGNAFGGRLVLDAPLDNEGSLELDASGLRDALGRTVETSAVLLATTATVTDLSLDTEPPAGALPVYGAVLDITSGELGATDTGHWPRVVPFIALVALGDPGSASAVGVEGRQVGRMGGDVTARVVRAGGATGAAVSLPHEVGLVDAAIPAGTGPIWLVLHSDQLIPQVLDYPASARFASIESLALVVP